jgi:hypothetical protein
MTSSLALCIATAGKLPARIAFLAICRTVRRATPPCQQGASNHRKRDVNKNTVGPVDCELTYMTPKNFLTSTQ